MNAPLTGNAEGHHANPVNKRNPFFDFRSLATSLFVCCILLGIYALNTSFESAASLPVYGNNGLPVPLEAQWSFPVAFRTSNPEATFLVLSVGLAAAFWWRSRVENTRIGSTIVVLTAIALVGGDICVQTFRESPITASTLGTPIENRVSGWYFYSTNTDTLTHLHKWTPGSVYTPTYLQFIRVVASPRNSRNELFAQNEPLCLKTSLAWHAIADLDSGMLLVAQTQRVLTLAAFLFLFFSISRVSTSSIGAILLVYAWCTGLLFATPISPIYSLQCIDGRAFGSAITWMSVSCMILALHRRSTCMLHAGAVVAGLAVISRPQNIVLLPMLMLTVLVLFRMKPLLRSRMAILAAPAIFAGIFLIPPGLCYFSPDRSLTPTNSFADILFATSLCGGEADDAAMFPDQKVAHYFSRALELQSDYRRENPDLDKPYYYCHRNQSIGYQVAGEMGMAIVQSRQTRQEIALRLICSHPFRLTSTVFVPLLCDAVTYHRPLFLGMSTLWLLMPYGFICVWCMGTLLVKGSDSLPKQADSTRDAFRLMNLLVVAHLCNLLIVPVFGGHGGYLHYTEGFLLLGIALFLAVKLKPQVEPPAQTGVRNALSLQE